MKDIKNYEGLYAITSCGKVWSYKYKKFLKPVISNRGYLIVALYKDGQYKWYSVHRLLAEAYIPNPDNLPEVDHIDSDKTHNYLNNLQWITHKDNVRKGNNIPILQFTLDGKFVREWECAADVRREVSGNICDCLKGRHKTAYGFIWKYKEDIKWRNKKLK